MAKSNAAEYNKQDKQRSIEKQNDVYTCSIDYNK